MKIAFISNGNSLRSQLAASIAKKDFLDFEIISVGSEKDDKDPTVYSVLQEEGLDLENIEFKSLLDLEFDLDYAVIVGCEEGCPLVFADKIFEWEHIVNPKDESIDVYREARNQLKIEIKKLAKEIL
ncbi:MAG: hypothetical protein GX752_01835 [Clostridium sp.]|nr:hypothetical protein [Clostridium sp.]